VRTTDWLLLVLLSVLWGGSFFFVAVAVRDIPPLTLVLARVALAAALLVPIVRMLGLSLPRSLDAWRPYAVAAMSTALAYIVFFRITATAGPSNVMLVTLLIPVSATALGTFVLGESLAPHQIVGALVIASGLVVIDGRLLGAITRRTGAS
jgi:drug/metabolite transporter (DMT)-like permease